MGAIYGEQTLDDVDRHRYDFCDVVVAKRSKCAMKLRSSSLELSIQNMPTFYPQMKSKFIGDTNGSFIQRYG